MSASLPPALFRMAAPHPGLLPYVRSYIGVEQRREELVAIGALSAAVLQVTWGGRVAMLPRPGESRSAGAFPLVSVSGPFTMDHRVRIGAGACGFHVRFTPTGALALLRTRPEHDEWDDEVSAAVTRWAERIVEATSFEARVALADAFWLAQLPASAVWSAAAAGLVVQAGGVLPIYALADTLGVSARTLRRRFADDIGLSTKMFARIEQYRQAHAYLLRTPGATWRDVCERYGYADQAHFIRAFRRFTGESPTHWRAEGHGLDLGMGLRDEGA